MQLLRAELAGSGFVPCMRLEAAADGRSVKVAGLVITRQRPGSANGVVFVILEDETGIANLVVWPYTFERFRRPGLGAVLLGIAGRLQREGQVIHVVAEKLLDLAPLLRRLEADPAAAETAASPLPVAVRDFH